MSEPGTATALERDTVFRKLRAKPENKVQMPGCVSLPLAFACC